MAKRKAVAAESPKPRPGEVVPRPNGAGALRHGSRKGNKRGAGRPPGFWIKMCQDGLYRAQTVEVMVGIISGDIGEQWFDKDGEPHYDETKNSDRIKAAQFLAGYAYGQPSQRVEVEDTTPAKSVTLDAALEKLALMARTMKAIGFNGAQSALKAIPEAEVEEIE